MNKEIKQILDNLQKEIAPIKKRIECLNCQFKKDVEKARLGLDEI